MYLKDAMTEYSFDCRIRKLSTKTIDNYMKQLRYFQTYLEEVYIFGASDYINKQPG